MILIITCITILYLLLIGSFIYGFNKVDEFKITDIAAKTKFSIIIPFRNEADNLPTLLESIKQLKYPKSHFEILLVDDESEDNSVEIINDFIALGFENLTILKNKRSSNSPKKDAITTAIKQAKYEWIITTDADCQVPEFWLSSYDCFIQSKTCKFIVAPVKYYGVKTFLERFQTLDFLSLIGVTIGCFGIKRPFLANGANVAYKKSFFNELTGFEGNLDIASGDDVFLLQKAIKKEREAVKYLKATQAIVLTKPQANLSLLLSQRLRWAAKSSSYKSSFAITSGLLVFIMNATLICTLLLVISGMLKPSILFNVYVIKTSIDFLLIFKTSRFFNQESLLPAYLLSSLIYPFFCVYIVCLSTFKSYKWKGRTFKK